MDTEQTLSTRELAGGRSEAEGERAGRFDRGEERGGEPASADGLDERREEEGATAASSGTTERPAATTDVADDSPELLPRDENAEFQRRWESIQTGFVDEPRRTVEQADELVAHVMKRLAEGFAAERERLEGQWGRGEDVSTEDLRIALQRYRGFFQRLLSA